MTVLSSVESDASTHRRTSLALFFAGYSTFSLLYCVQPLLPLFAQEFVVSPAESSLALSLSTGFLAFAILCAGALSEMLGRRGLMFWSMMGAAVLNIAAAFFKNWHMLLIIRALEGFILGGVPAVAMAYLAEEINPRKLGSVMGVYIAGTAFGGMMGRVGMGLLVYVCSWRASLVIMGIAGLIAATVFIVLLPRSRNFSRHTNFDKSRHIQAWNGHLCNKVMLRLYVIGFLIMGTFVAIFNYAGFRLTAAPYYLSQTELGLIFTVYLLGAIASSVAGALADRIGRSIVMRLAIMVTATGVALTLLSGFIGIIVGIILLTVGFFSVHSTASSSVGRLAGANKSHASSLYLLAYYLGSSVIGSVGGWFFGAGGWLALVLFAVILLILAYIAVPKLKTVNI